MIVRARAPLRIDLAGGWTDVLPYAARSGGAVVNVAIALYANVFVRTGGDGLRLLARDLGAAVTVRDARELRPEGDLALVKAVVRRLPPQTPAEVVTGSDAPPGSGLGGSGAMGVALVAALRALRGERPLAAEVATEAHDIELHDAGVLGGKQDQYAAALGGVQFLTFDDPGTSATRLDVHSGCLRELQQSLVLCYTGASRLSAATHEDVWRRYEEGDRAVAGALDGLRSCAHGMRDALEAGSVGRVAELLSENWRHQRALGDGMQTAEMRTMERAAAEAGADGAKACGAGAGGCLVFLARPGREADVADALRAAGGTVLPFTFDMSGVVTWRVAER